MHRVAGVYRRTVRHTQHHTTPHHTTPRHSTLHRTTPHHTAFFVVCAHVELTKIKLLSLATSRTQMRHINRLASVGFWPTENGASPSTQPNRTPTQPSLFPCPQSTPNFWLIKYFESATRHSGLYENDHLPRRPCGRCGRSVYK